jgi:hypothetical protein
MNEPVCLGDFRLSERISQSHYLFQKSTNPAVLANEQMAAAHLPERGECINSRKLFLDLSLPKFNPAATSVSAGCVTCQYLASTLLPRTLSVIGTEVASGHVRCKVVRCKVVRCKVVRCKVVRCKPDLTWTLLERLARSNAARRGTHIHRRNRKCSDAAVAFVPSVAAENRALATWSSLRSVGTDCHLAGFIPVSLARSGAGSGRTALG